MPLALIHDKSLLPLLPHLRPRQNGRHFADGMLEYIFLIEIDMCFRLKFHKHCFLGVTIPSIGSGNGSASIRRQAINWTNDGLGPVSLKLFLTEFKFDENLILHSPKF